jgi:DNA-binding XRE family transcriptional regulator
MHLVTMDALARYVGVSRPTLQAIVAHDAEHRSFPRTETSLRIAQAFGVSLNALYSEPLECLREALEHLYDAPITEVVEPPPTVAAAFLEATKTIADLTARRSKRSAKATKPPQRKGR